MIPKLHYLVIFFNLLSITLVFPQQGKLDVTFNTFDDGLQGDGFDNTVRTVSLQSDGKLIVGGDYLNFNGSSAPYLCRLYPDGSMDTSFVLGTNFNGKIYSSLIQPDGKIILGGSFQTFNETNVGRLIRLNSDGSQDTSFDTSIAVSSGIIYASAIQSDGKVIIVGSFTKYNGTNAYRVARILVNGDLDPTFVTGTGASGLVEEVQIQSDGKVLLAGSFVSFNEMTCNRIVRLNTDGSIDTTFTNGIGFDNKTSALDIQFDGKILVGGTFSTYNGVTANRIIRLNTDGSIDASFNSGSGFSNDGVSVIKIDPFGSIMVGGSFTGNYNGTAINRLVLLDSNGVIDPGFDIGSGPASATVYALTDSPDSSWFIGGSFSVFDSQNQGRLAKIDNTGLLDIGYLTAGVGFNNSVLKVISMANNKTMIFGGFTKYNGVSISRIARLLEDGSLDPLFNLSQTGANNTIKCATIQPDNKIIFAGSFTNYNGLVTNRIARILPDGTTDPDFSPGTAANGTIYSLALQPDGKIIIAGSFTSYNGTAAIRTARLLTDGTLDSSFNVSLGADATVETITIQPDEKIVLGGHFISFNGISKNRLVRLNMDGSIDSSFSLGSGFDKTVYSVALQSDNKLIIGGAFLNFDGISSKRIVRLNTNGSLDSSFTIGSGFSNGDIRTILVQADDALLLGGTFTGNYNGFSIMRMARLTSSGLYDDSFSVTLNNSIYSICFTPDNKALLGGNFNSVSGIAKHRIARIKLCTNSSVWNGINWSNGMPSPEKTIFFNENYPSLLSLNACSCVVSLGKTVSVQNGHTLGLIFEYSGLGSLVLENNASLYQSEDEIINTGIIHLKRETTPIFKSDYTYWSSPVSGQRLIDVSPNTTWNAFYSFEAIADDWLMKNPTEVMEKGIGYIIRGPDNFSTTNQVIYEATFSGVPNNGIVSVPIATTDTSNLIGNPYPSAINVDAFLIENAEIIDGTIYLWTHNTPITNNVYTADDYATYNLLGGVGTSAALNSGINNTKPDGKIASGQAFFTTGINGGGIANFRNGMRVVGQNSSFFKSSLIKKSNYLDGVEKNRLWLNLSNKKGAFKQILIGYASGASNNYDRLFDGESFGANQFIDFYSIIQDKNLTIQGKALPFEVTDQIFLGYSATTEGEYTIGIDQVDGLFTNQAVHIVDNITNTIFNLQNGDYTFNTESGTFNDRFKLGFLNKTLGNMNFENIKNWGSVEAKNNQIKINSLIDRIEKVLIYDLSGKQLYKNINLNSKELSILHLTSNEQPLFVKVILKNGTAFTSKIIY